MARASDEDVDVRGVLAGIPLFADTLSPPLLDALAHKSAVVLFPAGSILMTEGDFATSMFAIVAGEVAVTLGDQRGEEHDVAVLKAGDIVGEMSLMTGARRSATASASTPVVAIEITKFSLETIFSRAPELIDRFGEILHRRQAELDEITAEADRPGRDHIISQIRRFFGG